MIYLASPYSHLSGIDTNANNELTREQRYVLTMQAIAIFSKLGHVVYSPIVHCHEVAKLFGMPTNFEFWVEYNHNCISASSETWVLCLPNWNHSRGVNDEIEFSKKIGHPVKYFEFDVSYGYLLEFGSRKLNANTM